MKFKLMIQSLSPLALLTIINNFSFITTDSSGAKISCKEFFHVNYILLFVLCFCSIWVILSLCFYIEFKAFQYTDKKSGYEITGLNEKAEDSLNFFLTMILPLLIDNINNLQGALVFFIVLVMICILLYKTKLFYANPVLAILGYRIYEFSFCQNAEIPSKEKVIGICSGSIRNWIEYKKVADSIFYVKGDKR